MGNLTARPNYYALHLHQRLVGDLMGEGELPAVSNRDSGSDSGSGSDSHSSSTTTSTTSATSGTTSTSRSSSSSDNSNEAADDNTAVYQYCTAPGGDHSYAPGAVTYVLINFATEGPTTFNLNQSLGNNIVRANGRETSNSDPNAAAVVVGMQAICRCASGV